MYNFGCTQHKFLESSLHEPKRERIVTNPTEMHLWEVVGSDPVPGRGNTGRGLDQCGQATKGVWGMSRRQEAMKGVEDCEKPGGAVKRALIPGFPNVRTLNP